MVVQGVRSSDEVLAALRKCDLVLAAGRIEGKFPVVVVGGAAVIVGGFRPRVTMDVDVVQGVVGRFGLGDVLHQGGLHIVSESVMTLHPDYMVNAIPMAGAEGFQVLDVKMLSPYDLAISKIGRGHDKDFSDAAAIVRKAHLDTGRLTELYNEAVEYWVGDEKWHRHRLQTFLGKLERGELPVPGPEPSPVKRRGLTHP